MRYLLKYLKPFFGKMGFGFTIKTLGTVSELMLPFILSHVLKNVIGSHVGEIIFWGSIMIFCSGVACLFNVWANRIAASVSKGFAECMRRDLFSKTLHLSASQTDFFTIPSLESRITTDTYNVHGFVNMLQRMGVRAPIMLFGGIAITLLMDAYLSLIMIAMIPFIFITVLFIRKKGVPLYEKVQKSVDSMIRVVREDTQGIRVIKALSKNDYEHKRYDNVNKTLVHDEKKAGIIMGSVNPVMTVLMNMGSVLVIAISAGRVSGHMSDPETVIAFMQYFTHISMSLMAVTRMFMMYTKSSASAKRISEVLEAEEDIKIYTKEEYPDINTDYHIVFENVTFSYNGKKDNIKDINLNIKKGESIGIIGATGSGKSTLIKLLMRFYDTDKGSVYINGENIKTIEKKRLCEMFGCALQQEFLYSDTIEENIKFGRDISFEDVKKAAKIAQADTFIEGFKEGYGRVLSGRGTNISGGQKQRVMIARAIAASPQILVLDDSCSALDYKTDALLREALNEEMKDVTTVTVAQRVSTIKDCGQILVLEEGEVIGLGTHEELMENCSQYRETADSQMGGAFVE